MSMLDGIFAKLNLGDLESKVYVALLEGGITTAGDLSKKLHIPRSTLYGFLTTLSAKGLVRQSERRNIKVWQAEQPEKIVSLLETEANEWEKMREQFVRMLPELKARQRSDFVKPRFHYFEGIEGVKHILQDMLLYRDITTEAFWPIDEMINVLGEDFFIYLNTRRIKQNLFTKALWPSDRTVDIKRYPFLGVGNEFKREIRKTPAGIDCTMGYWAYADKVAFISSRKECFGFIVESRELRQMLKTQFEIIWSMSQPIKVNPKDTEEFLSKIV